MDVLLEKHGAKHVYKVPEGLRELCMDISREVLRSQPTHIYRFIADYVDTLLITRENTKVAVEVVNNILRGSKAIVNVLYRSGLSLEQIAIAAPRIQQAFRDYLDSVDVKPVQPCTDETCEYESQEAIKHILENTGVSIDQADRAATIIQSAFRGHYERMLLNETQGRVQWQRAVAHTLDILKQAGVPPAEIKKAAPLIQYAYRGYYMRRNMKILDLPGEKYADDRIIPPRESIQAVAWLDMIFVDSGLTLQRANEAAQVIQQAYKKYRRRKSSYDVQRMESTKSMIIGAILDSVRQKVFEKVMQREEIPEEYGTREDLERAGMKLQAAHKDQLRKVRISQEGMLIPGAAEAEAKAEPTKQQPPEKKPDEVKEEVAEEVKEKVKEEIKEEAKEEKVEVKEEKAEEKKEEKEEEKKKEKEEEKKEEKGEEKKEEKEEVKVEEGKEEKKEEPIEQSTEPETAAEVKDKTEPSEPVKVADTTPEIQENQKKEEHKEEHKETETQPGNTAAGNTAT